MRTLKTIAKLLRLLFFSFMFAICMVLGVVPVIPKRKEEYAVEIQIKASEKKEDEANKTTEFQANC